MMSENESEAGLNPSEGLLMCGASWVLKDLHYATDFLAHDPITYIEADGRHIIITDDSDVPRARQMSSATEVWSEDEFDLRGEAARRGSVHAARLQLTLQAVRRAGLARVVVPEWFPLAYADHLRENGVGVRVDRSLLHNRRRCKSEAQITSMVAALRVAEASLDEARSLISQATVASDRFLMLDDEPLTSERLQRVIRIAWAKAECEGETATIACGPHSAFIYEPGHGPIRAGEPILCDLWPRQAKTHYHADITRVFCVGSPGPELMRAHLVVREALELARESCRPGACGREIYADVCDLLDEKGIFSSRHPDPDAPPGERLTLAPFLGHSIGLDVHEDNAGPQPSNTDGMRPGDVMTLEPTVYRDGWGGVRLEDMIVITDDGCETLTQFDYDLAVE